MNKLWGLRWDVRAKGFCYYCGIDQQFSGLCSVWVPCIDWLIEPSSSSFAFYMTHWLVRWLKDGLNLLPLHRHEMGWERPKGRWCIHQVLCTGIINYLHIRVQTHLVSKWLASFSGITIVCVCVCWQFEIYYLATRENILSVYCKYDQNVIQQHLRNSKFLKSLFTQKENCHHLRTLM